MNIYFTSDSHFSHTKMWQTFTQTCPDCLGAGVYIDRDKELEIDCPGCCGGKDIPMRAFRSDEEMDEFMVAQWNATVRPQDHVWHLGDVAMTKQGLEVVRRLNGHKRLIFGNHDIFDWKLYHDVGFKKFASYKVMDNFIFSHIPLHPMSLGKFRANVHGHTHTNGTIYPNTVTVNGHVLRQPYINVCVEQTNYAPVDLEWIRVKCKALGGY